MPPFSSHAPDLLQRNRSNGWLAGWLDGWLAGWLIGWLAGWLSGLGGWVARRLPWLDGWLPLHAPFIASANADYCLACTSADDYTASPVFSV